MNARESFLRRRYRVEMIIGAALGVACAGIAIGLAVAQLPLGALHQRDWINLGLPSGLLVWLLFTVVQRVRWLDSAVPESPVVEQESRPAV